MVKESRWEKVERNFSQSSKCESSSLLGSTVLRGHEDVVQTKVDWLPLAVAGGSG